MKSNGTSRANPPLLLEGEDPSEQGADDEQEEDELVGVLTERAADLVGVAARKQPREVEEHHHDELKYSEGHEQP